MSAPRDQVTCKQCGAVLGQFVDGEPPRLELSDNVRVFLWHGRVDIYCPACGQTRAVDLSRYEVFVQGRAA